MSVKTVEIVADLLASFAKATVTDATNTNIRLFPADGVLKEALFAHPRDVGKPARFVFRQNLPQIEPDERLVLLFDTALSDGIPPGERQKSDGVDFRVEIQKSVLFARHQTLSRWTQGAADLTRWAGKEVQLALVTDARQSLAYDWALWAKPRIVRLGGVDKTARCGIIVLELRGQAHVTLYPRGSGEPIHFEGTRSIALPFDFPKAEGVDITVAPASALIAGSLRIAAFAPKLTVTELAPTVPVPLVGQALTLRVEVRNTGEGWLAPGKEVLTLTVAKKVLPAKPTPPLAPGERAWLEWPWSAPAKPGSLTLECRTKRKELRIVEAKLARVLENRWLKIEVFTDRWARVLYKGKPAGILTPLADDLSLQLEPDRPWLRLRGSRLPTLYAGQSQAHAGALFPGVEYLAAGEPSSSPRGFAPPLHLRHTPPRTYLTAPLLAVSFGSSAKVPPRNPARFWCPDSLHTPSIPSASPSLWTMGIFGKPGDKAEFSSPAGLLETHALTLGGDEATLFIAEGGALCGMREWLKDSGGLPQPTVWPRASKEIKEALALSRNGFETLWVPQKRQWKAVAEGQPEPNAGIAALLWWDGLVNGELASLSRAREAVGALTPAQYAQRGACHLMRFELPFLAGSLPEAFGALKSELSGLCDSQAPDGGWRFGAKDGPQHTLGQAGDSVSGVSSHAAWMLLRWARISGDREALTAGERALRFVSRFELPRGASLWECPLYEPDVLAAVWLLAANLEGWTATNNPRWLREALRWAEMAVPFVYLWGRPERPAQLGACIATLGTTFYTLSWLGRPVQWEGLILAWHLGRLADALEKVSIAPGALRFTSSDWRRLSEMLLSSGLHQQVSNGTYPDSITDFQDPQPVFINPENIFALLLAKQGKALEIQTVTWHGLRVSSLAHIESVGEKLRLRFFPGETTHFLVSGPEVRLKTDGKRIEMQPVGKFCRTFALTSNTPLLELERDL